MDETHFQDPNKRWAKRAIFFGLLVVLILSIWQREAILGYFSFREHGEARIVIYAEPGTTVRLVEGNKPGRVVGRVGRDGRLTLVEEKAISGLRLSLQHSLYFAEEKNFDFVGKGEVVTFRASMAPLFGSVEVSSFPVGAKIWVDDEEVGTTPWTRKGIPHGTEMLIQVGLDHFVKQSRQVRILGGQKEEVLINLRSTWCAITLVSPEPTFSFDGLKVFLNEELRTMVEGEIKFIEPGKHELRLIASDGLVLQKQINLMPGQHLSLHLPDWFVKDEV
ncbi:MAG: PEGA domain-containing protein [Opitutae bacterium]|nr:PEGA domain-containing protein [Opitutae bacterium]